MGALKKPDTSSSLCNAAAALIDNWCDESCEPAFRLAWIMHDFAKTRGKPTGRSKLVDEFYRIWRCYRSRFDEGGASKLAIAALRASARVASKTSRMANVIDHAMQLARNMWPSTEISPSWRPDYYLSGDENLLFSSRITDDDFVSPEEYVHSGETADDIDTSLRKEARLARDVLDKWLVEGYSLSALQDPGGGEADGPVEGSSSLVRVNGVELEFGPSVKLFNLLKLSWKKKLNRAITRQELDINGIINEERSWEAVKSLVRRFNKSAETLGLAWHLTTSQSDHLVYKKNQPKNLR